MASTHEFVLYGPLEWDTPLSRTAIAQYDQAVPYADVHEDIAERLRYPERATIVSCPVRLWEISHDRDISLRTAALEARGLYP